MNKVPAHYVFHDRCEPSPPPSFDNHLRKFANLRVSKTSNGHRFVFHPCWLPLVSTVGDASSKASPSALYPVYSNYASIKGGIFNPPKDVIPTPEKENTCARAESMITKPFSQDVEDAFSPSDVVLASISDQPPVPLSPSSTWGINSIDSTVSYEDDNVDQLDIYEASIVNKDVKSQRECEQQTPTCSKKRKHSQRRRDDDYCDKKEPVRTRGPYKKRKVESYTFAPISTTKRTCCYCDRLVPHIPTPKGSDVVGTAAYVTLKKKRVNGYYDANAKTYLDAKRCSSRHDRGCKGLALICSWCSGVQRTCPRCLLAIDYDDYGK